MTYTYRYLTYTIQVPSPYVFPKAGNLSLLKVLPVAAMLLATKLGEMEWFPNEFQVDLLKHKTLCWRLEVGDFVSGRNLLRTTLPKTNIAPINDGFQ